MNPDLITLYANQYKDGDPTGLAHLLSLFDAQAQSLSRQRAAAQAYLSELVKFHKDQKGTIPSVDRRPAPATPLSESRPMAPKSPTPKTPTGPLNLDL